MFDACGIQYERYKDNAYYEDLVKQNIDKINDFQGMEDHMLYILYKNYHKFPTSTEYMKRIVDRLCNEEDGWENDSLRLRILKQFIKYGHCLNYRHEIEKNGKIKFKKINVYQGEGYLNEYLEQKLGEKADVYDHIDDIDDHVFDILKTASSGSKKASGRLGLLKISDDLANGNFRDKKSTKKTLYLFAIVFHMTYYSGNSGSGQLFNPKTDLEVNLFRDYYTNNLMRYLSHYYRDHLDEFDLDPSGQGINYRNYAEVIYIYFISKNMSSLDKIKKIDEMIKQVEEEYVEKDVENINLDTAHFRSYFLGQDLFSEDLLSLDEEQFKDFVLKHYHCNRTIKNRKVLELVVDSEQHTAFREFLGIKDSLKQLLLKKVDELEDLNIDLYSNFDELREKPFKLCDYGLWFTDLTQLEGIKDRILDHYPHVDAKDFNEFLELLQSINDFMIAFTSNKNSKNKRKSTGSDKKLKTWDDVTEESITRTTLIVIYYYYFNALHETDSNKKWMSFHQVFNYFKQSVDRHLVNAYYQPLNGKNIFDVIIAFSVYAYLNY